MIMMSKETAGQGSLTDAQRNNPAIGPESIPVAGGPNLAVPLNQRRTLNIADLPQTAVPVQGGLFLAIASIAVLWFIFR